MSTWDEIKRQKGVPIDKSIDNEKAAKAARREAAMTTAGLTVLLSRAGGTAEYTEAEYQEIPARYGGTKNLAIHMDVLKAAGEPPSVRLTLIRKAPASAELIS